MSINHQHTVLPQARDKFFKSTFINGGIIYWTFPRVARRVARAKRSLPVITRHNRIALASTSCFASATRRRVWLIIKHVQITMLPLISVIRSWEASRLSVPRIGANQLRIPAFRLVAVVNDVVRKGESRRAVTFLLEKKTVLPDRNVRPPDKRSGNPRSGT